MTTRTINDHLDTIRAHSEGNVRVLEAVHDLEQLLFARPSADQGSGRLASEGEG